MNLIDLFSGAGGLSLGLKRAGYNTLACVEINRDAMNTYASHEPDATHFNQDIRTISFEQYRGKIDIVSGAELSRDDIALALNTTYQYLCDPNLSGRNDIQKAFLTVTDAWLDARR